MCKCTDKKSVGRPSLGKEAMSKNLAFIISEKDFDVVKGYSELVGCSISELCRKALVNYLRIEEK